VQLILDANKGDNSAYPFNLGEGRLEVGRTLNL